MFNLSSSTVTELAISVITLISAWYIGNKSVWGQRLSLVANASWWFYVIAFQRLGMIPMEIFFTIMCVRNLVKWEKDAKPRRNIEPKEDRPTKKEIVADWFKGFK